MPIVEIRARTLLRKFPRIDSLFVARSGLNLYRGCAHDCAYCDGRTEKYRGGTTCLSEDLLSRFCPGAAAAR